MLGMDSAPAARVGLFAGIGMGRTGFRCPGRPSGFSPFEIHSLFP